MEKVMKIKEWIQMKSQKEIDEYIRTSPAVKASYDAMMNSMRGFGITPRGYGISSRRTGEAIVNVETGEIKVKAITEEISQDFFIGTYPDSKSIQEESISLKPTKQ